MVTFTPEQEAGTKASYSVPLESRYYHDTVHGAFLLLGSEGKEATIPFQDTVLPLLLCPLMLATCSNTQVGLCVPRLALPMHWRVALNPEPSWSHLSRAGRVSVQRMFSSSTTGTHKLLLLKTVYPTASSGLCPALSNTESHGEESLWQTRASSRDFPPSSSPS